MLQLLEAIGEVKGTTGNAGVAVYPPRGGKEQISLRSLHDPRLLEKKYRWEYRLFGLRRTIDRLRLHRILIIKANLARPERFELPTTWFEARYSIQLSYGRVVEMNDLSAGEEDACAKF